MSATMFHDIPGLKGLLPAEILKLWCTWLRGIQPQRVSILRGGPLRVDSPRVRGPSLHRNFICVALWNR